MHLWYIYIGINRGDNMKHKIDGLPALLLLVIPIVVPIISILTKFNYLDLAYLTLVCVIFIKYQIQKQR